MLFQKLLYTLIFILSVPEALEEKFSLAWSGRDGPIHWLTRCPDLIPLGFFWGYIKNNVYSKGIIDINNLKRQIIASVASPGKLHKI